MLAEHFTFVNRVRAAPIAICLTSMTP